MFTTMLVEDNASFGQAVRDDLLSRFPSMKVIEASNGEEAFKGLASNPRPYLHEHFVTGAKRDYANQRDQDP